MNNSSTSGQNALKEKVKQRFTRIYKILLEGCGRELCFCKLCKSNPEFQQIHGDLQPGNTTAGIALKNTTTETPICEDRIVPKSLQPAEVDTLVNEAADNTNYLSVLFKRVTEVFGSYESVNISFLPNGDFKSIISDKDPRIDFDSADKFFSLLSKMSQNQTSEKDSLKSILNKSLTDSLESFNTEMAENRIVEIGQIRFLPLLLEIPEIFDFPFQSAFLSILKISLNLAPNFKQALINWLAGYTKQRFSRIVENFSNIISIQVITNHDTGYLKNLMQFTKILFEANKISELVSYEDFYVETISQEVDPREEFATWMENKTDNRHEFTYIDYPWILECDFKSIILEVESVTEMNKVRNEALRGALRPGSLVPSLDMIMASLQNMYFKLVVRRQNVLEDTLNQIARTNINFKQQMKVKFDGEQGVDEGGVKKEFFQLITRQLLTPDYGMFTTKADDRILWFNMTSIEAPLNFELAGMILGLSIYNAVNLDVKFPIVVYKKLLDEPLVLKDLREIEPELYKSLKHIQEYQGNLEEDLFVQFQVTYDFYGEEKIHELKSGGSNINVTQENKNEYISLYLDWYFNKSIESQFRPFYKGFYKVVTGDAIRLFTGQELLTLICGSSHLDFEALEKGTAYEGGYTKDTPIIKSFWEVIHSFNEEQKRNFLAFSTGSDRAPIKGLGSMIFVIARHGPDSETLPSAHTCFNHLLIPEYSSKEKLQEKLLKAIQNSEGFGLF